MITIRGALPQDARLIWEWANEQAVRTASFQSGPIAWADHERWFAEKLLDSRTRIFVVFSDGRPVGQIRFECTTDRAAEIDINVAVTERGRGTGSTALRMACARAWRELDLDTLVALIKSGNQSSLRAFEKAGFTRVDSVTVGQHQAERLILERGNSARAFLFRVDAGPGIGLGHVQRCLAVAGALRNRNAQCLFLLPDSSAIRERMALAGCAFEALSSDRAALGGNAELEQVIAAAVSHRCDTIVVDSYFTGDAYFEALGDQGFRVAVFDDDGDRPLPVDVIVNSAADALTRRHASTRDGARLLLGPDFAPVRHEFVHEASRGAVARQTASSVEHVLVTLGGSSPAGARDAVLRSLDAVAHAFRITVVCGPFDETASPASMRDVRVVTDPPNLPELMASADLAVCGGGQTLYELATVGTPAVALQLFENQAANLEAMAVAGTVCVAGVWPSTDAVGAITSLVQELCDRADLRAVMSAAGQRLIDGRGACRVADALLDLPLASTPSDDVRDGRQRRGIGVADSPRSAER
jgi:spore coat polysaccharide biosynthesis predicted glycosyltransferase SpsG/RimJ/RimL family protein N-acetyltransferase